LTARSTNIADASGDTGRGLARAEPSGLRQRAISALTLAPVPVAAIWFGPPWLPLVTLAAAAVMAWEWSRLCRRRRPLGAITAAGDDRHNSGRAHDSSTDHSVGVGFTLVGVVVAAVATAAFANAGLAVAAAFLGAAVVYCLARGTAGIEPRWAALGALWVALPCVAFLWLADAAVGGRAMLLWLLAAVWATDIGAYAFGRAFGGPLLAPHWSPRKTWAGLGGGVACAALTGAAAARILGTSSALSLALLSAGLAVVGQFGDLAESLAKRRFGVKDSSGLIPGHGGLLDRLDGLLAVLPTVALLTLIGGRSVLTWQ
jgi:phosphatidate cytidylyltransferase